MYKYLSKITVKISNIYIYIYIYIYSKPNSGIFSIYYFTLQLLIICFLNISSILDHIMSVLTNIDNKNHIFIKIISDYYININLYIYKC